MHELSLCQGLVDGVLAELRKIEPPPVRLIAVRAVIGGMRQVLPEYMQDAYRMLAKGTPAEGSVLEIRIAPIIGRCKGCGWKGEFSGKSFRCEACGSNKAEIIGGMELYLENIEIEESEAEA